MKVAIVMPSCNSEAYLLEALNSIFRSKFSNEDLTVYLIDNCSSDNTLNIALSKLNSRSRIKIFSQSDSGPAAALNLGFKKAIISADIIGWLNSDDYYSDDAIQRVIKLFEVNSSYKVIYGLGRHVNSNGENLGPYPTLSPKTSIDKFQDGSFICQPSVFFRNQVFKEIGFLDESLKTAFDLDFWIRIFKKYSSSEIGFINRTLAFSRLHDKCLTKMFREIIAIEGMTVLSRHFGFANTHWVYTYLNELCDLYPFVSDKRSLSEIIIGFLKSVKLFIAEDKFELLLKDLKKDYRLNLSNAQVFCDIHPDGWASKEATIKFRYDNDDNRKVTLHCSGGWPFDKNLHVHIFSSTGDYKKLSINSQDKFSIVLKAPEATDLTYHSWIIKANQFFVPANVIKNSNDFRKLSFRINNITVD